MHSSRSICSWSDFQAWGFVQLKDLLDSFHSIRRYRPDNSRDMMVGIVSEDGGIVDPNGHLGKVLHDRIVNLCPARIGP